MPPINLCRLMSGLADERRLIWSLILWMNDYRVSWSLAPSLFASFVAVSMALTTSAIEWLKKLKRRLKMGIGSEDNKYTSLRGEVSIVKFGKLTVNKADQEYQTFRRMYLIWPSFSAQMWAIKLGCSTELLPRAHDSYNYSRYSLCLSSYFTSNIPIDFLWNIPIQKVPL